jgi:hypothetical protein
MLLHNPPLLAVAAACVLLQPMSSNRLSPPWHRFLMFIQTHLSAWFLRSICATCKMWHLAIGALFSTKPSLMTIFACLSLPSDFCETNIKLLLIPRTSRNGQGNLFVQLALSSVSSSHVQSLRHALQATAGCWHCKNQDTQLNVPLPVALIMLLFSPTDLSCVMLACDVNSRFSGTKLAFQGHRRTKASQKNEEMTVLVFLGNQSVILVFLGNVQRRLVRSGILLFCAPSS